LIQEKKNKTIVMGVGVITFLLVLANFIVSYNGFNNRRFYGRLVFQVEKILVFKDYKRLVTSGFLHVGWMHLIFNMVTLYAFGGSLERALGPLQYLLLYFASLIGGNLLSLFIHRNHAGYRSVGASGAIAGVMFGAIALYPNIEISFFFIPLPIPAWVFGLAFMLISIYGIKSNKDNIGHDSHLGGALIGMVIAIATHPSVIVTNYIPILIIGVPALVFLYMILTRPNLLLVDNYFFRNQEDFYSIDHKYNQERANRQKEVDRILEKIHKKGLKSLTREERELLKRESKSIK
jgi:membrane associated rhomboid family serine protease